MLKSKNKFLLIVLVVLLISGLCLGLIACKPDEPAPPPPPQDPEDPPTVTEVFTEVLNKIAASYPVNTDFKIDAAASAEVRKKNADGTTSTGDEYVAGDFAYELIVKANVKLGNGFTDEDNYYLIELNDKVSGAGIIQLYFETQSGEGITEGSYIYASLFGSEIFKINGFSLEQAVPKTPAASTTADIVLPAGFDIIISTLFNEEYEVKDGNYKFTLNINGVWDVVNLLAGNSESVKGLLSAIPNLGLNADDLFAGIDGAIAQLFGELTLKDGSKVTNYDSLIKFVNENIPTFTTNLTFNFNGDKFSNASFYMDMVPQPDTFSGYVVKAEVSKVDIAAEAIAKADVLANSFVEKNYTKDGATIDSRFAATAINIVNFNYTSEVQFLDANKNVVRDMDIRINADINPFTIIGGITKESLMAMGSFSIEIQNKNSGPYQIGIHYDPKASGDDSVYYYIALSQNNANPAAAADTMVLASSTSISSIIASLTNDTGYATTADGQIDIAGIVGTLGKIFGALSFTQTDLTITTAPIFKLLYETIEIQGIDIASLLVGKGTEYIKAASGTFTYGGVQTVEFNPNKWVAETLKDKISNGTEKGKYIDSSTVKLTDKVQVPYGTPFNQLFQANSDGVFANVSYEYIGSDTVINSTMQIKNIVGYDPTKEGNQKVVLQAITSSSDLIFVAGLVTIPNFDLLNVLSNVPILVELEVLPSDNNIEHRIDGTRELVKGDDIISKLNAKIITNDAQGQAIEFGLNKFMITAASTGVDIKTMKATAAGKQWIEVKLSTGTTKIEFNVAGVEFKGTAVIGGNLTTALQAELTYVDTAGAIQTKTLGKADITEIKIDTVTVAKVVNGVLTAQGWDETLEINELIAIVNSDTNLKKIVDITYKYETGNTENEILYLTESIRISKEGSGTTITNDTNVGDGLKLGSSLHGAVLVDIYKDSKVVAANYRIAWLPFNNVDEYDYTNTGYGFRIPSGINSSEPLDPDLYTVDVIVKNLEGVDVTAEAFQNGVFVKAGTYIVTISGTVTVEGDVYPFTATVKDSSGEEVTVGNYYNSLSINDSYIEKNGSEKLTMGKRMLSNTYAIKMYDIALKDYTLESNDRLHFDGGLKWDDTLKTYNVSLGNFSAQAADVILGKLPMTDVEMAEIKEKLTKGTNVNFYYSNAEQVPDALSTDNWTALCDANGYVTTSGSVWIKVVAEFNGETIVSVTGRKINVAAGEVNVTNSVSSANGVHTYYVGQKIEFTQAVYYSAGVAQNVDVTAAMLSVTAGDSTKLSTDGFIRFTEIGEYTVNVTIADGVVVPVEIQVIAPGLQKEFKENGSAMNYAFFGVGADVYAILSDLGYYKKIVVNADGSLSMNNATVEEIRTLDPIGNGVLVEMNGVSFTNGVIASGVSSNCKQLALVDVVSSTMVYLNAAAGAQGEVTMSGGFTTSGLQVGTNLIDVIINNSLISIVESVDSTSGKATVSVVTTEWVKTNITFGSVMGTGETVDENGIITEMGYGMFSVTLKSNTSKTFAIINQ